MRTDSSYSLAALNARYHADGQPRLAAMREETRREPVSEGGAACVLLGAALLIGFCAAAWCVMTAVVVWIAGKR